MFNRLIFIYTYYSFHVIIAFLVFSIADAWRNCLTSMSDFKELIPEFYDSEGEFLEKNPVRTKMNPVVKAIFFYAL
jgi:hypothetical protein